MLGPLLGPLLACVVWTELAFHVQLVMVPFL